MKKLNVVFFAVILFLSVFASCENEKNIESTVIYSNTEYGFEVTMPASWERYSIIEDTWTGADIHNRQTSISGLQLSIRHPLWSEEEPQLDIPIMIITLSEWEKVGFWAGATAMEYDRNSKYVFAMPPRYYYHAGWEDISDIINNGIRANENIK